jgi:Zn-finger nucleic acid-binding protein
MQSPVYTDTAMEFREIEPGLCAYLCPKSEGVWIPLQSYLTWKESHKNVVSPLPSGYNPVLADDSHRPALICPESGRLLIRYRVGHGLRFHVDVSPVTGGVWLDKGEWEALKVKGLHSELNLIFTASYQRQIRNAEYEETLDQRFSARIGAEDFKKVAAFKTWLAVHPKRRDICCYLMHNLEKGEE